MSRTQGSQVTVVPALWPLALTVRQRPAGTARVPRDTTVQDPSDQAWPGRGWHCCSSLVKEKWR